MGIWPILSFLDQGLPTSWIVTFLKTSVIFAHIKRCFITGTVNSDPHVGTRIPIHLSLIEVRILGSQRAKMLQECICQEIFNLSGKIWGWLAKCSKNTTAGLKYIDFYPNPCILALIIKLTLSTQNFFMIVSKSSPTWEFSFCKEKVVKEFLSQGKGVHDQFQVQSPLLFLCHLWKGSTENGITQTRLALWTSPQWQE